jgi:hypothetical protein
MMKTFNNKEVFQKIEITIHHYHKKIRKEVFLLEKISQYKHKNMNLIMKMVLMIEIEE